MFGLGQHGDLYPKTLIMLLRDFNIDEISTTEGWVDVMYNSVDSTSIDMQPIRNYNVDGNILFYLAFMLIGCFFVMNTFVGVLLDNFDRIKRELGENGLLTEAQVEWVAALKRYWQTLTAAKVARARCMAAKMLYLIASF